jgi:CubicO group peptidase (beta-lactamase class C family)
MKETPCLARRLTVALLFVNRLRGPCRRPAARQAGEVGLSTGLENIRKVLGAQVDAGVIPGYVALVARRGKVVYHEAYGVQNPNTKKAMPRDAIFRIYSMTKPITSVAAMILVRKERSALRPGFDVLPNWRISGSD